MSKIVLLDKCFHDDDDNAIITATDPRRRQKKNQRKQQEQQKTSPRRRRSHHDGPHDGVDTTAQTDSTPGITSSLDITDSSSLAGSSSSSNNVTVMGRANKEDYHSVTAEIVLLSDGVTFSSAPRTGNTTSLNELPTTTSSVGSINVPQKVYYHHVISSHAPESVVFGVDYCGSGPCASSIMTFQEDDTWEEFCRDLPLTEQEDGSHQPEWSLLLLLLQEMMTIASLVCVAGSRSPCLGSQQNPAANMSCCPPLLVASFLVAFIFWTKASNLTLGSMSSFSR